jgi:alanine racemase
MFPGQTVRVQSCSKHGRDARGLDETDAQFSFYGDMLAIRRCEMAQRLSWCEISARALAENMQGFRAVIGPGVILAPVVKANAYGHGLELASSVFVKAGADALCVNDLWEAACLRRAGFSVPIHVIGRIPACEAAEAVELDVSAVVYDFELVAALNLAAAVQNRVFKAHVKLETGTNRQGLGLEAAAALVRQIDSSSHIVVAGAAMHFADVEDTTDHQFAQQQLDVFVRMMSQLGLSERPGIVRSVANSAATILWQQAHFEMVRPGISAYGMWPSSETLVSAALTRRDKIVLKPALTWKTTIVQVKDVLPDEYIGYGRTFRATSAMRIAVIPVGYFDGYDRSLSNGAYALVNGRRAQIRGRVCMNMAMIDVTGIPEACPGSEVVLMGRSGDEVISAEKFGSWCGSINYEVTCRIAESIPRLLVEEDF